MMLDVARHRTGCRVTIRRKRRRRMPNVADVKYAVKITRQCLVGGEPAAVGTVHHLPPNEATALIRLGRAVHAEIDDEPKAQTRKPKMVKK